MAAQKMRRRDVRAMLRGVPLRGSHAVDAGTRDRQRNRHANGLRAQKARAS